MSVSTTHTRTYTCGYCGSPHDPAETVEKAYCSTVCYYRDKGEGVLGRVESTSQFCNTCYAHVREVEPVPDRVHPDADGYQYQTPNTVIGVDDFASHPHDRLERTRWSCRCGAVDPGATTAELQNADLGAVIANLYRALAWLAERDAIAHAPDWDAYADALRERPRDAAFACGKAVYADG